MQSSVLVHSNEVKINNGTSAFDNGTTRPGGLPSSSPKAAGLDEPEEMPGDEDDGSIIISRTEIDTVYRTMELAVHTSKKADVPSPHHADSL